MAFKYYVPSSFSSLALPSITASRGGLFPAAEFMGWASFLMPRPLELGPPLAPDTPLGVAAPLVAAPPLLPLPRPRLLPLEVLFEVMGLLG